MFNFAPLNYFGAPDALMGIGSEAANMRAVLLR